MTNLVNLRWVRSWCEHLKLLIDQAADKLSRSKRDSKPDGPRCFACSARLNNAVRHGQIYNAVDQAALSDQIAEFNNRQLTGQRPLDFSKLNSLHGSSFHNIGLDRRFQEANKAHFGLRQDDAA